MYSFVTKHDGAASVLIFGRKYLFVRLISSLTRAVCVAAPLCESSMPTEPSFVRHVIVSRLFVLVVGGHAVIYFTEAVSQVGSVTLEQYLNSPPLPGEHLNGY